MKLIYPSLTRDFTNPLKHKELIGNYLISTFEKLGVKTEIISSPIPLTKYFLYIYKKIYKMIFKKNYLLDRAIPVLKSSSNYLSKTIAKSDADFIFAFGTLTIAYLKSEKPIYIITDGTFEAMHGYNPNYSNVCKRSYKNAEMLENLGFSKARKIFLSSEWAIQSALNHYKVPPSKVVHTYLGANIPNAPTKDNVTQFIETRSKDKIKLILIGKNWYGKGADIAIAINNELIKRGYKSNLTVIGCKPADNNFPEDVHIIENLDKSKQDELEEFQRLLSESHFMLFPTRFDTFGHVVCEASAYGVPTIASQTGGVGDAVKDGVNGFLIDFKEGDSIQKSADIIEYYFNNRNEYNQICLSSFKRYQDELNWDVIVSKILDVIKEDLETISKMEITS